MKIWKRKTDNNIVVRRYLLGSLPEADRERLERLVLNQAEINDELLATEDELIDQYLGGRLDATEREQFERHFLLPRERQRKLRFGGTLRQYFASNAATANQDLDISNEGYFVRLKSLANRPAIIASLVLVVSLAILGAYWISHYAGTGSNVSGETLAITLAPGSSRANGGRIQRIESPVSYRSVEVQLEMGTHEYTDYEVELLREGKSLNTYKTLYAREKDGRFVLPLTISASLLEPGDYTFKLSGTNHFGQIEFKDQYQLRVIPHVGVS